MKKIEFLTLRSEYNIDPSIVLENEDLVKALKERNDKEIKRIFKEEF